MEKVEEMTPKTQLPPPPPIAPEITTVAVNSAPPPVLAPLPPPQPLFTSVGVQAVPRQSVHEVSTLSAPTKSTGMNHTEGGWPAEVDPTDGEQVARWRKKVERDEDYIRTVLRLGEVVEDLVRQNNAIDIYADYFADMPPISLEPPRIATLSALRLPSGPQGPVQTLAWCPDNTGKLVCSYPMAHDNSGLCSIFDISRPTAPLSELHPCSPALCLAYSLRDHNLLGAGLQNGQFALFDTRQGPQPVALSDLQCSHSDCLMALAWTQSKTATEFMTASLDGKIAFWDTRKLTERLETIPLREKGANTASTTQPQPLESPCLAATCLEYSASAGPSKFMVGTSLGPILSGNRRAKTPADRITGSFAGHVGAIRSLSRHHFFPKHFLSVGDWTVRVWSEDIHTPLVTTPCSSQYLSGGAWSTTRPSVFYTTSLEGSIEAWDLLQSHAAPVISVSVADCPLTGLAVQDAGGQGLLAVGTKDGTALVLKPSAGLTQCQAEEKEEFAAMMERESGRERALEKVAKDAKAKARREAAKAAEPVTRVGPAELQELEKDFLAAVAVKK